MEIKTAGQKVTKFVRQPLQVKLFPDNKGETQRMHNYYV